jgi:hypothetical protein
MSWGGNRGGGRPSRLTPDVALKLSDLWLTDNTRAELGRMFGVGEARITRWARHLGLPPKVKPRRQQTQRVLDAARARRARDQAEQAELLTITVEPRDDLPVCWVCGGASKNWDGHDQCRGRRNAA